MPHHPPYSPRQPQHPPVQKREEWEAEERMLRATIALRTNERAHAQAELDQRLVGLRQSFSEQLATFQQQWHALHQQVAEERARTSAELHRQRQRVRSPLQIGLSLLSPAVARDNLRTLRASQQALQRPAPREQWLLSQITQVERTMEALRRELMQPRDTPRMQELRRAIAWLTGEIQRLQVQADCLAARIAVWRQQPQPQPGAPVLAGGTTSLLPVGLGQPRHATTRECWHCRQQIVVTPRGTCPQCGAPIKPIP
jgi:hypothetical protein